jgi:hypothetical protein
MTNKAFCVPKEHDTWTKRIISAALNVCKIFFQQYFRKHRAAEDQINIANVLCDALVQFWGEATSSPQEQNAVAEVLQVLEQREVTGNEGTKRLLKTLLQAARMHLSQNTAEKHQTTTLSSKVMALYPSFRLNFKTRINFETELAEVVHVCRQHPRAVTVITNQLTAYDADRSLKRKYIRVLRVHTYIHTHTHMYMHT